MGFKEKAKLAQAKEHNSTLESVERWPRCHLYGISETRETYSLQNTSELSRKQYIHRGQNLYAGGVDHLSDQLGAILGRTGIDGCLPLSVLRMLVAADWPTKTIWQWLGSAALRQRPPRPRRPGRWRGRCETLQWLQPPSSCSLRWLQPPSSRSPCFRQGHDRDHTARMSVNKRMKPKIDVNLPVVARTEGDGTRSSMR